MGLITRKILKLGGKEMTKIDKNCIFHDKNASFHNENYTSYDFLALNDDPHEIKGKENV